MMSDVALNNLIGTSFLLTTLGVAILVILNILILKLVTWIVTNTVIDTLEKRGYGKGVWRK